eukprot:3941554-Rhodomonas_salina.1
MLLGSEKYGVTEEASPYLPTHSYAMSGTDLAYAASSLCTASHAISGTDLAYGATRSLRNVRIHAIAMYGTELAYATTPLLCAHSTDPAYAATRSQCKHSICYYTIPPVGGYTLTVLSYRMLLPGVPSPQGESRPRRPGPAYPNQCGGTECLNFWQARLNFALARLNFARGANGDHLSLLNVFSQWQDTGLHPRP